MRKTPENLSYEIVDEGCGSVIALNGVPCLQMRSVGTHSTPGREKEEKKERAVGTGFHGDHVSRGIVHFMRKKIIEITNTIKCVSNVHSSYTEAVWARLYCE